MLFSTLVVETSLKSLKFSRHTSSSSAAHSLGSAGLVDCVEGANRNITTDNYYITIILETKLKCPNLILVGTMEKNKTCISSKITRRFPI